MSTKKIWILYFSVFPSTDKFTERFAKLIAEQTGGDLVEIQSVKEYPDEYKPLEALAKEKKPNLFEFMLDEKIRQRRKILSSKYKESGEPNGLDSNETK